MQNLVCIGVDVGGTNTDAVAVRFTPQPDKPLKPSVQARLKTPTTPDATQGIVDAISGVLQHASIDPSLVSSVTIGTTHFINAVIERDERRLRPVAILRVSKSFLREVPPFSEWPSGLASILYGYIGYLDGGLHIDGAEEAPIVEQQVIEEARKIKELGLSTIVVAGVFSPIDDTHKQEDRIRDILLREIPHADVVCSHTVANLGFMERENASILNAAILGHARKTIGNFKSAMRALHLTCPLLITGNDGTVIDASSAAKVPIRTFLSGPTNSMRGAACLSAFQPVDSQVEEASTGSTEKIGAEETIKQPEGAPHCIVIDIGGTTSDLGILMPSGMPMQAAAYVKVAGVEVNYSLPHLYSIGLGGGSIVREEAGKVLVGPQSVGSDLTTKALVFGGDTLTATDIAVAAGKVSIGDPSRVSHIPKYLVGAALDRMKLMLERAVDVIKLSPDPLPVLLVGGGAILAPDSLEGGSKLIRPQFYDVANAVGAAASRVCGLVDIIQSTLGQTVAQAIEYATVLAIQRSVAAGALKETVRVAELEAIPISYVENRVRTVVRAVGDLGVTKTPIGKDDDDLSGNDGLGRELAGLARHRPTTTYSDAPAVDPLTYRPKIVLNESGTAEWDVSETDVEYLADGCYVLGCAGGGSPRSTKIQLINMLRKGHCIRIVDASSLNDDDVLVQGGGLGSPAVGVERLAGIDAIHAVKALLQYLSIDQPHGVMSIEIGGANGLQPLLIGSSRFFNVPVVDADWMGRAYPTAWQTTLCAHSPGQLVPCAIDAGDGNSIIMTSSSSDKMVDSILRAACVEMGSAVGAATKPSTAEQVRNYGVLNSLSFAWRIGRCITRSKATNTLSTVAEAIVEEAGGSAAAKVLFRGKIVEVENRLSKGHSYGVVHIKAFNIDDDEDESSKHRSKPLVQGGVLRIPFKNENIVAKHTSDDGTIKVIASVPDLIAILDNGSGKAIGVSEFKYGYRVTVVGFTCSPRWVDSPTALEIGGPSAFGFDTKYVPIGTYIMPKSVIEEFRPH